VSRDGACVHLKFVHAPVLALGAQDQDGFITAFIEVENVKALYAEYVAAGATFDQKLKKQAWGGRDFIVRGPDGNGICCSTRRCRNSNRWTAGQQRSWSCASLAGYTNRRLPTCSACR
jgi:hypothetical protein